MDIQDLINNATDMKELLLEAGLDEDDYNEALDFLNDLLADTKD